MYKQNNWLNSRFKKIKGFFIEYIIGKYKILFFIALFNVFLSLLFSYLGENLLTFIISFFITLFNFFVISVISHYIFKHKKIKIKNTIKTTIFVLLNFLFSFLLFLFIVGGAILFLLNKIGSYIEMESFTREQLIEISKLSFYYSLLYPFFIIFVFILMYILFFSVFFSGYYHLKHGFKRGLLLFWKDFLSKKNIVFFIFILSILVILKSLNSLLKVILDTLLVFPVIKLFHYIKETNEKKDFYGFCLVSLILLIFAILMLIF